MHERHGYCIRMSPLLSLMQWKTGKKFSSVGALGKLYFIIVTKSKLCSSSVGAWSGCALSMPLVNYALLQSVGG